MKFRYTFEKDFQKKTIVISLVVMQNFQKHIDRGYKVIKIEVLVEGKWVPMILK